MVKSQIALDIFQMKALNEIGLNTKDASMASGQPHQNP